MAHSEKCPVCETTGKQIREQPHQLKYLLSKLLLLQDSVYETV